MDADAVLGPPLSVLDAGVTLGEDGALYPTVRLDVRGRPEVADLARVHAVEGVGDVATAAGMIGVPGRRRLRLAVVLTRPVTCAFQVELDPRVHASVLRHAADRGCLLLATAPAKSGNSRPSLAIDIDGSTLRRLLENRR